MLEVILGVLAVGIGAYAFNLKNQFKVVFTEKIQSDIILEMATQERESLMERIDEVSVVKH